MGFDFVIDATKQRRWQWIAAKIGERTQPLLEGKAATLDAAYVAEYGSDKHIRSWYNDYTNITTFDYASLSLRGFAKKMWSLIFKYNSKLDSTSSYSATYDDFLATLIVAL